MNFYGPPKVVTAVDLYQEDYWWLPFDIAKGSVLYVAKDTWGVCTPSGMAVSLEPSGEHYFEVPEDAVYKFVGYVHSLN